MPINCSKGKAKYRFRKVSEGKQRLAFCGKKVVEVKNFFKNKVETKRLKGGK